MKSAQFGETTALKKGRTASTTWKQRVAILDWLEVEENFKLITGSAAIGKKITAGAKLTKTSAYTSLADHVNYHCFGSKWNKKIAEARYRAYFCLYKKTRRALDDTSGPKFGIGKKDIEAGITTLDQKIHKICPYYKRMDLLIGGRQNIKPSYVLEPGDTLTQDFNDEEYLLDDVNDTGIDDLVENSAELELNWMTNALEDEDHDEGVSSSTQLTTYVHNNMDDVFLENKESNKTTTTKIITNSVVATTNAKKISIENKKNYNTPMESNNDLNQKSTWKEKLDLLSGTTNSSSNSMMNSGTKHKKDFNSVYEENQSKKMLLEDKKIDLEKEKFEWEKSKAEASLFEQKQYKHDALKEESKRQIIISLITAGKSEVEIQSYLKTLNYD